MRFLHRLGHHGKVFHFVELAIKGHLVLGPCSDQNFDGFVVAWPAFFERDIGGAKEPRMAASQPAFETPTGEDVCLSNLSGKAHGVFEWKGKQSNSKPNALGELRRCAEECQRVGRDREFLEEMMIDHRVDIKTDLIGVLDLAEYVPSHVRMRFSWRGRHLRVDAEFHGPSGAFSGAQFS